MIRLGDGLHRLDPTTLAVESSADSLTLLKRDHSRAEVPSARWPIATWSSEVAREPMVYAIATDDVPSLAARALPPSVLILLECDRAGTGEPDRFAAGLAEAASGLTALHAAGYRNVVVVPPPVAESAPPKEHAARLRAFALVSTQIALDLRAVPAARYGTVAVALSDVPAFLPIVGDAAAFCRQADRARSRPSPGA